MNIYYNNLSKKKIFFHIIALLLVMFVGDLLSSLPFDIIFRYFELPYDWIYSGVRVLACIMVIYLFFRFYTNRFLHSRMEDFRIGKLHITFTDIVYALLLPTFVIVAFIVFGRPSFNRNMANDIKISIVIISLFKALKAGILEEMLFRGYIMKLFEMKWNKYIAIVLPSFVFSLVHIPSMETFNFVSLFLLICSGTLVGIMFSIVAYKNNSIWGSALIHTLWNLIMCGDILHIYFGKETSVKAIFSIILPNENILLTGAGFGVESSIIAIIGYIIIGRFALLQIKNQK